MSWEEQPPAGRPRAHAAARQPVPVRVLAWVLAGLFVVLVAATALNLYVTLSRTSAACSFYRDLAGLPVQNAAGANKPAELGVSIIAHSRQAWRGSGCAGTLPPPAPSFARWAPYYGLPAG